MKIDHEDGNYSEMERDGRERLRRGREKHSGKCGGGERVGKTTTFLALAQELTAEGSDLGADARTLSFTRRASLDRRPEAPPPAERLGVSTEMTPRGRRVTVICS